ncbi:MAG TPA: hypothetical protein VE868_04120 [Balneolaceae bacterium]|nr:hypothetical protein [Balneolaceae bacterium]
MIPLTTVKAQSTGQFKPGGHVFGQFFGDYYYKLSGQSNSFSTAQYTSHQKNFNAVDIRRLYFGYDYNFSPRVSGKMELANEGNFLSDGNFAVYIKSAQLKINDVIPNGNLILGETGTPTFATFTEHIWGYRSLAKTLPDMRKFGGSHDLGIALQGNFSSEGIFGYELMIGNGRGSKVENNKYKKIYLELHAKLKDGLLFELYSDYEGNSTNGINTARTTFKGFAGYQIPNFTVGLSAITQTRKNAVQNNTVNSNPSGLSVFAHGSLIKNKLNGMIRYDFYNPDKSSNYNEHFFLAGLDYLPAPHVHLMPNMWVNSYGSKGGVPSKSADVVARLTFYYNFP